MTVVYCIHFCSQPIQRQNDDKVVKEYYDNYWNVPDDEALKTGLPDKFLIECVKNTCGIMGTILLQRYSVSSAVI